jgi:hypothetical protein
MSNLIKHAKKEFQIAGWTKNGKSCDGMQGVIMKNIIELLEVFANQHHSGSSAPYVIGCFEKLASFEIISPLTGDDSEWEEICSNLYQNNRDCRVFKKAGKPAYFIDGKIFSDDGGETWFTNKDSHVEITFPCKASDLKPKRIILKNKIDKS